MTPPPDPREIDLRAPQWSIGEFAAKANEALADKADPGASKPSDSRLSSTMTERNLRRLVSQGAIEPPARLGREAYFGPKHLEQVLAARALMAQGFTSSSIQALRNASAREPAVEPRPEAAGSPGLAPAHALALREAPAPSPSIPSTADALLFLSRVAPRTPSSATANPFPQARPTGRAAPPPHASGLTPPHAPLGGAAFANAYQSLVSGEAPAAPAWVATLLEAEPFAGMRIAVSPRPGMAPLDPSQKAAAIECVEQLWAAAMAAAGPLPSPPLRGLGAPPPLQTSSASTPPRKDPP